MPVSKSIHCPIEVHGSSGYTEAARAEEESFKLDRERAHRIALISWIAIAGNLLLAALKITGGLKAGSLAVLGDGIDSTTDIVASGITGMQLTEVVRAAIGWLMIRLGFLIVVTCISEISLYPNIMFGKPA